MACVGFVAVSQRKGGQKVTPEDYQTGCVVRFPLAGPDDVPAFSIGGIRPENSRLEAVTELRKAHADAIDKGKETVLVEVYPCGVEVTTGKEPSNPPPVDCSRGKITSFTDEAKRRLKHAFMTLWIPGGVQRAVTMTTHKKMERVEFQSCMDRFTAGLQYRGWAAVARKEKQTRGALHAHLSLWTPQGVSDDEITELWLKSTGEAKDKAARKYAVKIRTLTQDEAGWVIYMGKHDAKDDEGQQLTEGKHWGILNKKAFTKRCPDRFTLNVQQHAQFLRILRRHQQALRRSDVARLYRAYVQALGASASDALEEPGIQLIPQADSPGRFDLVDANGAWIGEVTQIKEAAATEKDAWKRLRKLAVKPLHRGDLLRLVPGPVASRIVQGLLSGALCGANPEDPF